MFFLGGDFFWFLFAVEFANLLIYYSVYLIFVVIQKQLISSVTKLTIIDVHSGLGPLGKDTLMVEDDILEATKSMFGKKESTKADYVGSVFFAKRVPVCIRFN